MILKYEQGGTISMIELIKPQAIKRGDKIAMVSLSWGGAGDIDIL